MYASLAYGDIVANLCNNPHALRIILIVVLFMFSQGLDSMKDSFQREDDTSMEDNDHISMGSMDDTFDVLVKRKLKSTWK